MDKIATYVAIREEVTAAEVLTKALELDPRSQGRREGRRVADVLQSMGWRRLVTSRKDPVLVSQNLFVSGNDLRMILWLKNIYLTTSKSQ